MPNVQCFKNKRLKLMEGEFADKRSFSKIATITGGPMRDRDRRSPLQIPQYFIFPFPDFSAFNTR